MFRKEISTDLSNEAHLTFSAELDRIEAFYTNLNDSDEYKARIDREAKKRKAKLKQQIINSQRRYAENDKCIESPEKHVKTTHNNINALKSDKVKVESVLNSHEYTRIHLPRYIH